LRTEGAKVRWISGRVREVFGFEGGLSGSWGVRKRNKKRTRKNDRKKPLEGIAKGRTKTGVIET